MRFPHFRKKPKGGEIDPRMVASSHSSMNANASKDSTENSSVAKKLLPSTHPSRAVSNSVALSETSTADQDLDTDTSGIETVTLASADGNPDDLWNRAYVAMHRRGDLKKLMDTYERILLKNLRGENSTAGTFAKLEASEREEQMSVLVQKKVYDMEQQQTKLRLGGKEMKLRPQFDRVVKGVLYAKGFVTSAVSVDPHAALAWAGVCVFLPLLLNPSKQHKALEEGLAYISDLICRFTVVERTYFQQKMSRPDATCSEDVKRLRQRFEDRITNLYSQILEYQARVVCHPDHKLVKLGRDLIAVDGWVELLLEIKKSEVSCEGFTLVLDKETLDYAFQVQNRHLTALLQAHEKRCNELAEAIVTASKVRSEEHRTDEETRCHIVFRTSEYEAQKNRNPTRVDGTCNWFLQHSVYRKWRDEDLGRLLWVSADPGCGKSVLSRSLIDNDFHEMESYAVCYFFFKDDNENQKSVKNAMCSILHQLFEKRPHLLKHSLPEFRRNGDKIPGLFDTLWTIFKSIAADPEAGNIICVLDALDECEELARINLMDKLNQLYHDITENGQKKPRLKYLITSRPYSNIESNFDSSTIRLAGEEESESIRREIDLVIEDKVSIIASKLGVKNQAWFQPYLKQKLTAIPHRTYLWLHLILDVIINRRDRLSGGVTKRNLEAVVNSIPETVDEAYTAILQKSTDKIFARKLLHIVVAAKRPLTLEEMNIALNVEDESRSYDDLGLEPKDAFKVTIRNLCGLFVSVIDSKIYLMHQTAKEFLINKSDAAVSDDVQPQLEVWKHSLAPEESACVLTRSCILYLLFSVFEDFPSVFYNKNNEVSLNLENEIFEKIDWYCNEHKFLYYSSHYWTTHFCEAESFDVALPNKALNICGTDTKRLQTWLQIYGVYEYLSYNPKITSLTVAARFGLLSVVQLLLNHGANLSDTDSSKRTALIWAISEGHESVTQLLLDNGADPSCTDEKGRTALIWAVISTHESMIQLLLDHGADLSHRDRNGMTALLFAVGWDEDNAIQLLLKNGANVTDKTNNRKTALHMAAKRCSESIIQLLLDKGAVLSATDEDGMTALLTAAERGRDGLTQLLLNKGADITDKRNDGTTALHMAAAGGHDSVIQLLLKHGADPLAMTNCEETALDLARSRQKLRGGYNKNRYEATINLLEPITESTTTTNGLASSSTSAVFCVEGVSESSQSDSN